jgi:predicted transcriptional regulator
MCPEVIRLREMLSLGYSTREIAAELGRSPEAVYAKTQKHKFRERPVRRPWTEAERDLVRSGDTVSAQELGDMLGRTRAAINHMREKLGKPKVRQENLSRVKTRITQLGRMTEADMVRSLENEKRAGV